MTEVLNSRAFHEIVAIELRRVDRHKHPITLAYLDVDNFKQVNDTLGHSAGDSLLHAIAVTIRHNIRLSDTVSRLGGDEFAILMPETDSDNAKKAINKLHEYLIKMVQQNKYPVTFSIGVVSCHYLCKFDELIKAADKLMYSVKSRGKNGIAYGIYEPKGSSAQHTDAIVCK